MPSALLPHYQGLYETARDFRKPTPAELDRADGSFPPITRTDDLVDTMVQVDQRWDNLKAARTAGWTAPKDSPDIDPPHEALILRELFWEAHRPGGAASGRAADLLDRLDKVENQAQSLEDALRRDDRPAADTAAKSVEGSCTECHNRYRDPALSRHRINRSGRSRSRRWLAGPAAFPAFCKADTSTRTRSTEPAHR